MNSACFISTGGGRLRRVLALAAGTGFLLSMAAAAITTPPAKPGFPITVPNGGNLFLGQPLIADLGLSADGTKSIAYGTPKGELHVIYKNGAGSWGEAPGFPKTVAGPINSSPAAGDLDGDGKPDLVVGFGSNNDLTKPGGVAAWKNRGTLSWTTLWTVTTADAIGPSGPSDGVPDPVVSTPAIGDVDGDGKPDVAVGGFDHRIYLVDGATGAPKPGWPKYIRDTVWSSPVLHDIDGDGRPDIVIGVDAHAEGPPINSSDGGCLHVLRYDSVQSCPGGVIGGACGLPSEIAGFPKCIDQTIVSPPVVGDIDGDGKPEIVHGTGTFWPNRLERLYAWHCDGSAVAGWPVAISGQSSTSPALADLDGDGKLDVVATADNTRSSSVYHLYAFRGDGSAVFAGQTVLDFSGHSLSAGPPMVADALDPGTSPKILVPTNGSVAVFSSTGTLLTEHSNDFNSPLPTFLNDTALSAVAAGDLEDPAAPGAKIEVVTIAGTPFPAATDTKISVWNPVARSSTPPWGLFRQNPKRTGVAPGSPPCSGACTPPAGALDFFTLPPCRLVDTRNPAGPLGGPAMTSGQVRTFALAGSCGVPSSAKALALNVTVTQPTGGGFVRFAPGGCAPPNASTINFSAGQTRANNSILSLAGDGSGTLSANAVVTGGGTLQLLIDIDGYFQ